MTNTTTTTTTEGTTTMMFDLTISREFLADHIDRNEQCYEWPHQPQEDLSWPGAKIEYVKYYERKVRIRVNHAAAKSLLSDADFIADPGYPADGDPEEQFRRGQARRVIANIKKNTPAIAE